MQSRRHWLSPSQSSLRCSPCSSSVSSSSTKFSGRCRGRLRPLNPLNSSLRSRCLPCHPHSDLGHHTANTPSGRCYQDQALRTTTTCLDHWSQTLDCRCSIRAEVGFGWDNCWVTMASHHPSAAASHGRKVFILVHVRAQEDLDPSLLQSAKCRLLQ